MNLSSVIDVQGQAERTALIHRDEPISYGALRALVLAVQAGLEQLGISAGCRVVLVAGTTPNYIATLYAVLRAGAIAVPLNPLAPPPELQGEIDAVDPALVVVGPAGQANLSSCRVPCPVVALPGADLPGATPFDDFIGTVEPPAAEMDQDSLALFLFTSGTAGSPKPAMLTHGNLLANLEQLEAHHGDMLGEDDVVLGTVPLFHILGINLLLSIARRGGTMVLVERFDAAMTLGLIERHGVTSVSGPPTLWQAWADLPGVEPEAFERIHLAISGAAPLAGDIARRVEERLGIRLRQGYGLTEASPTLTLAAGTLAPVTSVGRPLPGVELRLVDSHGADVPVGDEGEIWARGRNVFAGYWNDPAATAAALTEDGWLRTGDLGVVDDDGYLYLVNRAKDLVVVSGFNVFPGEVEEVLRSHPAIAAAVVVGVPHPSTGEAVKAVVVVEPDAVIDEHEVVEFCLARLARYKCPTSVEVVAQLPLGLGGKIRRHELK